MRRMVAVVASAGLVLSFGAATQAEAAKTVKEDIPVPVGVAASADGSRVWVAGAVDGAVYRVADGTVRRPVRTRSGNANYIDVWTTATGRTAYLLDEDDEQLRTMTWGNRKVSSRNTGANPVALTGGTVHGRKVVLVLATGRGNNPRSTVAVVDRSTGNRVGTWNLPKGPATQAQSLALSPDGTRLYVGNLAGQQVAVFVLSTKTGKVVRTLDTAYPGGGSAKIALEVESLVVDASGRYLFAGVMAGGSPTAGTYKLDARTGEIVAKRPVDEEFLQSIATASTNRVVALGGSSDDGAPSTLRILKRKNLRVVSARSVPLSVTLATSTRGNWSRAHLAAPDANSYWAIPFRTGVPSAPGNG